MAGWLLQHSQVVLFVLGQLSRLHNLPADAAAAVAACMPAVMQLMLNAMRLLGARVQQQQQHTSGAAPTAKAARDSLSIIRDTWLHIYHFVRLLVADNEGAGAAPSNPAIQQMLLSPSYVSGTALLVAMESAAALLSTQQSAAAAAAAATGTTAFYRSRRKTASKAGTAPRPSPLS